MTQDQLNEVVEALEACSEENDFAKEKLIQLTASPSDFMSWAEQFFYANLGLWQR